MSQKLVLVAGIPGTNTPDAVRRLIAWVHDGARGVGNGLRPLRENGGNKFESLLFDVYDECESSSKPLRRIGPLFDLPKDLLRDYWSKTIDRLGRELGSLPEDGRMVLLPAHLTWFHPRHREFMPVFDAIDVAGRLAPHTIEHVVCLIDDVHDVYCRLRGDGALYDREAAALSEQAAKRGHALRRHISILDWRSREITAAESLAARLGRPFSLLATKHQPSVGYACLVGKPQVYISHPITEPRRLELSAHASNNKVDQELRESLWELQDLLASRIALLQPTCIDEYRLATEKESIVLRPRFYRREKYSNSLFSADGCSDHVIYDDLPETMASDADDKEADLGLFQTAATFVENQVTARDLQLVSQATHLIVYRPRFNGNLSGGVSREVSHFRQLRNLRSQQGGKILFLDSAQDKDRFAPRQFLEALAHASLQGRWSISLEMDAIVDYMATLTRDTRAVINEAATQQEEEITRRALNCVLADLGIQDPWSLGVAGETKPLVDDEAYSGQQERKTNFLRGLASSMTPFEKRPEYADHQTIWIDGKPSRELAEEVLKELQADL